MPPCAGHTFLPPAAARRTLWVTLVVMATAAATCRASLSPCAHGRFFSSDTQTCRTCSPCPRNQIIRRPCGDHSDTLCGPFSEFFRFHQAPRLRLQVADLPLPEEGGGRAGGGRRGGQGHEWDIHGNSRLPEQTRGVWQDRSPKKKTQGQRHKEHDVIREGVEVKVVPDVSRPWTGQDRGGEERSRAVGDGRRRQQQNPGPRLHGQQQDPGPRLQEDPAPRLHSPDGDESGWKVLALALIIVLCVVCVVLISFISVLCYLRSRRSLKSFCPAGDLHRHSSGRLHRSLPYTPMCSTHAHTRAGSSDDTTGAPPGGVCRGEADDSGQTISKSSDYVYFTTPPPGSNAGSA